MADLATPLQGWGGFGQINGRAPFRPMYAEGEGASPADFTAMRRPQPPADPVEAARTEAFAAGFEEGFNAALGEQAEAVEARQRLAAALEHLNPSASGALSAMLSTAVIRLVGQIVGEVQVDKDLLLERCKAVAACVDDDAHATLRLNPDDLPLLEGLDLGVELIPDPALNAGSVRLDTADGWIEDGPDVRLARLRALLDDMEGRP